MENLFLESSDYTLLSMPDALSPIDSPIPVSVSTAANILSLSTAQWPWLIAHPVSANEEGAHRISLIVWIVI